MKNCLKKCLAIVLGLIICTSNINIYADEIIPVTEEEVTQDSLQEVEADETTDKVIESDEEIDTTDSIIDSEAQEELYDAQNEAEVNVVEQKSTGDNKEADVIEAEEKLEVEYSAHVKNIGWQKDVSNGATAGTTGKNLQMEGLRISLNNQTSYEGSVTYCAHVQNIGWQKNVADGNVAGTTGRKLRMEAVKIQLTGEVAQYYDIYYRTHIAKIGWMPWTMNGGISGSVELANQIEAIEIRVVAKNDTSNKPKVTSKEGYLHGLSNDMLNYSAHVQNIGNTSWVKSGEIIGTTGKNLRMEGITVKLDQTEANALSGTIMYRTHVQDLGWTEWKNAGQFSGTIGQKKRIEAIEIKLTGQLAIFYNVYYSAHIQNYGWLDWASNGQTAGSTGISYRMEALKIRLVRKDNGAPGATANYYKNKPAYTPRPATLDAMSQNAQGRASSTQWLIMTDTSACQVGVYSGSYGNWKRVALWSCGPGKPSTPTVKGEFTIYGRGKSFGSRTYTCWYYTQFYGNYLFHSVLYNHGSMTQIQDGTLGKQVSHGCVRLDINNAKWLYDNIPNGTKVVIY